MRRLVFSLSMLAAIRAADLLRDEHITVAEVAYQVGMGTPQYLAKVFKARFGCTPTQYQKGVKSAGY